MRIAVAGFQHETNSFAPGKAGLAEFEMADSWPGLLTGTDVIEATRGMNLPLAGFAEAASRDGGVELLPILWCAAEPSGPVTDAAFDEISSRILGTIRAAGQFDALYLDLHGAMITESHDDGEGELLTRVRDVIGVKTPIAISLDMHANITPLMVQHADLLCVFRTYPHVDMAETGARAFARLKEVLTRGVSPARAYRQAPFLVPLHAQHTGADPALSLYAGLSRVETTPGTHAELAMGFTAGDTRHTGISIVAHAPDQDRAGAIADAVLADVMAAETQFDTRLLSAEEAVVAAMAVNSDRPVLIADVQDNPGAGATADTTGIIRELIKSRAQNVLVGLLHDPDAVKAAKKAGPGSVVALALGGKSSIPGDQPLSGRFQVERLGDGHCEYSGEMYRGGFATLGDTAVLTILEPGTDIRIVVTSIRNQCLDLAHFTHLGLDPGKAKIVVVKSTAHFRAAFEPIAAAVLLAASPGAFPCRLADVRYARLRQGIRR